jgi:hypothetical protein
VEFIRNQLIAQHTKLADGGGPKAVGTSAIKQFTGSWDVVRHSMRQQGLVALWRGVSWSIYRDTLGCGCFFYAMAWTQHQMTESGEQPGMTATIVSGGVAGLSFWVASLPLDTIKTWVQSSDLNTTVSAQAAVQKIYRNSGVVEAAAAFVAASCSQGYRPPPITTTGRYWMEDSEGTAGD